MKIHELVEKSIEWVAYDGVLGTEPYALQQYLAKSDDSIDDDFFAYIYTLLVQHPSIRVSISQEPLAAQDKSVRLGSAPLPEGYEPPASIRKDVDITQMYQQGVKGRALAYHLFGQEFVSSKDMIQEKRKEVKQKVAKYNEVRNKKSFKKGGKKEVEADSEGLIRDIGADDGEGTARSDLRGLAAVWGSRLRLRCTDDEIYFRLVGTHTKNPKITSAVFQTLQHSVKSRERGITTVELGPLIGTSQGSMHHYMKTLTGLGLCAKVPAILHAAITNLLVFHKFLDQNLNYRAHIRADDQEQEEVAPVAPELDTIDADDERADNDHTVALGPSTAGEWGLNFAPLTEAQLMSGLTVNERMVKLLDHPGLTNHLLRAKNLLPLLGWTGDHEMRHRRAVPRALRSMILDDIVEYVEVGENKVKCLRLTKYNPDFVPRVKPTVPDNVSAVVHTLEDLLRQYSGPHLVTGGVSPLLAIPYQIAAVIHQSGHAGLIINDISAELFNLFRRFIEFFFVRLERQTKPPPHLQHIGYSTLLESYGKERRLRAFGRTAYRDIVEQSGERVDDNVNPPVPPEGGHFADASFRYYYNDRRGYNKALDKLDAAYQGPAWRGHDSAPAVSRPPRATPQPRAQPQPRATPQSRVPTQPYVTPQPAAPARPRVAKRSLSPESPERESTPEESPASSPRGPGGPSSRRPVGRPLGSTKSAPKKTKYETFQIRGRPRKYVHVVRVDGKVDRRVIGQIAPRPELAAIYVWLPELRLLVPPHPDYSGLGPPPPLGPEDIAKGHPPEFFDQFPSSGPVSGKRRKGAAADTESPKKQKKAKNAAVPEQGTEAEAAAEATTEEQDVDEHRASKRPRKAIPEDIPAAEHFDERGDGPDDIKAEHPEPTERSGPSSHDSRIVTPVPTAVAREGLHPSGPASAIASAPGSPASWHSAYGPVRTNMPPLGMANPSWYQSHPHAPPPAGAHYPPQPISSGSRSGSPFTTAPLFWNREGPSMPVADIRQAPRPDLTTRDISNVPRFSPGDHGSRPSPGRSGTPLRQSVGPSRTETPVRTNEAVAHATAAPTPLPPPPVPAAAAPTPIPPPPIAAAAPASSSTPLPTRRSSPASAGPKTPLFMPDEEDEQPSVASGAPTKSRAPSDGPTSRPAEVAKQPVPIRPAQATRKGGRIDLGAVRRANELTVVLQIEGGVHEEYSLWKKHREWSHRVAGTNAPHAPLKGATMDRSVWRRLFDVLKEDGRIDYTTATVPTATATWSKNKVLWLVDTPREVVQAYMRDLAQTVKVLTTPKDITTPKTHIPHTSYTEVRLPNFHQSSTVQYDSRDVDQNSRKLAGEARRDELLKDPTILSQLHGRQSGKFPRVKILHLAIRAAIDSPDSQSVMSRAFGAFVTSLLTDDIAAGPFYSIVMTQERDEDLITWLADPEHAKSRLRDVPFSVRTNGTGRRHRMRMRIKTHFDMLTALGVISPLMLCDPEEADVSADVPGIPNAHLKIVPRSSAPEQLRTLVMHDYAPIYHVASASCPLIGYLPIRTATEIEAYWKAQEIASLELDASRIPVLLDTLPSGVRNLAKASDTLQVTDSRKSEMRHPARWKAELRLLPVQRDALNDAVDSNLGICRLQTVQDIEAFAWEYALPLDVVKEQLDVRLERARTKARERREAAQRRIEAYRARQARAQQALARKLAERQADSKRNWESRVASACDRLGAQYSQSLLTYVSRQGLTALTRGSLTDAKIDAIIRYYVSSRYQELQQREAQRVMPAQRPLAGAVPQASPQPAPTSVEPVATQGDTVGDVPPMVLQTPTRKDTRKRAPKPAVPREKPFRLPGKRLRRQWSAEDHEMIVDAEAIIRCRNRDVIGNQGRYAMEQLFPGCLPVTFLSRLRKAIDTPEKECYLDLLEQAWNKIWLELRGTEELPDPIPESNVEFDLPRHIEVLRRRVNKNSLRAQAASMGPGVNGAIAKQPELPFETHELLDAYLWLHQPRPNAGFEFLFQAQNSQEWSLGQFGSMSLVTHDEQLDVKRDLGFGLSRSRLRAIIKMIVATPAGQYDQTTAIKLLRDYDQPTMVNPEISALVNEKILVRHASASLTGRFFSFAQSWLIAAQGPFASDFHDEASSMNEKLDCPGGYELPLISRNGGDIAALMSMVSDHQVDMGFDINTAPTVAAGQGILNTRKLSDISFEFDITAKRTRAPPKADNLPSLTECPRPRAWSDTVADGVNAWVPILHERVRQAGASGVTKSELKAMLSLDDQDFSVALAALSAVSPPEVFWAGYDTARLVSVAHWRDWLCPAISIVLDQGKVVEGGGAEIMCTPRRWIDIWGRRIDEAWNQAVECAKGWIMSRSGMSERLLRERLDSVMDRLEAGDVLQYLVDQGTAERLWNSPSRHSVLPPIEATDRDEETDIVWRVVPAKLFA